MATAPHLVADDPPMDPFAQLRSLIDKAQTDVDAAKGDPSRSTIGKLGEDLRELSAATQRVEEQQDPAVRLSQAVGAAVAQALAGKVSPGQPPIGRGGIYGIVIAVCMAMVGSPVLGRTLTPNEEIEALGERDREIEAKISAQSAEMKAWKDSIDRRLASEQRINAWLVEVAEVQTTALVEIAKALKVEVDLKMPVLWPPE